MAVRNRYEQPLFSCHQEQVLLCFLLQGAIVDQVFGVEVLDERVVPCILFFRVTHVDVCALAEQFG